MMNPSSVEVEPPHLMGPYLVNAWYAAAWHDEVSDNPLQRQLLGRLVVLWRGEDGQVRALQDRCAHRLVPLSCGKVAGNAIECGYHGLRFDGHGACVFNPHGAIPQAARVDAFTVVERHGLVWIWMGDTASAAAGDIPDLSFIDDRSLHAEGIRGYMHTRASYTLLSDNILDLGHIEFLHPSTLGSDAVRAAPTTVREEGASIIVERDMRAEVLPAFMAAEYGCIDIPVRRLLSVRWSMPANLLITISVTPPGVDATTKSNYSCHLMTPETERTTHYFWANSRLGPDSVELDTRKREGLAGVFAREDKPMVEAQQRNVEMDGPDARQPVMLSVDAGLVRVQRRLRERLAAQAGCQP